MKLKTILSFGFLGVLGITMVVIGLIGGGKSDDSSSVLLESIDPQAPAALCFMPGTDPDLVQQVQIKLWEIWGQGPLGFNTTNRWSGGQGNPRTLTWSIPNDGLFIPSGVGEPSGSNVINAMLAEAFGTVENGKNLIRQSLADWEDQTGITYTEVSDDNASWGASGSGSRGDIRIVAKNFGGAWAGVLAYNFFPSSGDMVINEWHEPDYDNPTNNFRFFRNTVAHENGHGIGILHVCSNFAFLMEPFIQTNFEMVQHDDLQAGQRHYGDQFENNNSSSEATFLGDINGSGSLGLDDISIDDNADNDWFSFTVDGNTEVTITATPVGFTYGDRDQNSNGSCPTSGMVRDSLRIHDLTVTLVDTNGSNVLETSNTSGEGLPEVLGPFSLPGSGTYFARILGDSSNDIQIYDLDIDVVVVGPDPVCAEAGTLLEGVGQVNDFSATCGSDNSYWAAHGAAFVFALTDPVVQFELTATAPSGFAGSNISVDVEASKDSDNAFLLVRAKLFNYTTGSYVSLSNNMLLTTTDTVASFPLPGGSDPADFVENGTDKVSLLLEVLQTEGLANVRTQLDEVLFNFIE